VKLHTLQQSQGLPIAARTAWEFFSNPANLARLTPPDMQMRHPGGDQTAPIFPGQMLWFDIRLVPGLWQTWVTEITHIDPGVSFIDEQRAGPYKLWRHRHLITPIHASACEVTDTVHYALPFYPCGELAHSLMVRPMLEKIFAYRKQALALILGGGQEAATP
jgi:ligand-binding SRPBCC domain-containing protein